MIGCLDRPTSGEYFFDRQNVANLDDATLAHIRNQKIGFVFQQFHLLPQLSAQENVELPMIYGGVSRLDRQQRARTALIQVGLGDRLQNRPNQLSGGQQQRVAIARAIVTRPVLLLADEPTGALDSQSASEVLEIFRALHQQNMTIIVVTHALEVARHSQRMITMADGQVTHTQLNPALVGQALVED
jgi:putative ABC transport system ATP-binding protein